MDTLDMAHKARRCAVFCLVSGALVLHVGCATVHVPPAPSQATRDSLGAVAVVPAQFVPQTDFRISWRHKEGATGKQAALTAAASTAATVAASTAWLGPIGVFTGAIAGTSMVVRDAIGTARGIVPAATATEIESAIRRAMTALDAQDALARQLSKLLEAEVRVRLVAASGAGPEVPDALPDYAQLRGAGIDTVIETAITDIGFDGCITHDWECKPPLVVHLFMRGRVRAVRVADGAVLYERPLEYLSGNHEPTYWLAESGRLLGEEFERAYRVLAERVYDELFLITPIELPYIANAWEIRCWLEPIHPAYRLFHGSRVDTLQPTLRWTAFPREIDRRELDPETLQKIGGVTYDVRIWDEAVEVRSSPLDERWRDRMVYERTGLSTPEHTLEVPLLPDSRYYWSVRARFVVDGRSMATRWGRSNLCFSDLPYPGYFAFDTPK
jgi:hypothetical protein